MDSINRRIEKAEHKVQFVEQEINERQARLLEMQRLGEDDSLLVLLLKLELEYGCKFTLRDLVLTVHGRTPKNLRRV
jgi:hypothetical protein